MDIVLLFITRIIDQYTKWMIEASLRKVSLLYFELMLNNTTDNNRQDWSERQLMQGYYRVEKPKQEITSMDA